MVVLFLSVKAMKRKRFDIQTTQEANFADLSKPIHGIILQWLVGSRFHWSYLLTCKKIYRSYDKKVFDHHLHVFQQLGYVYFFDASDSELLTQCHTFRDLKLYIEFYFNMMRFLNQNTSFTLSNLSIEHYSRLSTIYFAHTFNLISTILDDTDIMVNSIDEQLCMTNNNPNVNAYYDFISKKLMYRKKDSTFAGVIVSLPAFIVMRNEDESRRKIEMISTFIITNVREKRTKEGFLQMLWIDAHSPSTFSFEFTYMYNHITQSLVMSHLWFQSYTENSKYSLFYWINLNSFSVLQHHSEGLQAFRIIKDKWFLQKLEYFDNIE